LKKIDILATLIERNIFFDEQFDETFEKIYLMKLIGCCIGFEVPNFAEYQCKMSLNNLQRILKDITKEKKSDN